MAILSAIFILFIWIIYLQFRMNSNKKYIENLKNTVTDLIEKNSNIKNETTIEQKENVQEISDDNKSKRKFSFEDFILSKAFPVIGYLLFILAVGFLGVYIYKFISNIQIFKIIAGLLIGFCIILISCILKKENLKIFSSILSIIGFLSLLTANIFSIFVFRGFNCEEQFLVFALSIAIEILSFAFMRKSENKVISAVAQIIKLMFISIIYSYLLFELNNYFVESKILDDTKYVMFYIIIGFIYSVNMKQIAIKNKMLLCNFMAYLIGLVSINILLCLSPSYNYANDLPVLNIRFITYLTAILTAIYYAKVTNIEIYRYIALVLSFIIITFEMNILYQMNNYAEIDYALYIFWLVCIGLTSILGILKKKKYLLYTGIVISFMTLLKLPFMGFMAIDIGYMPIALILLGSLFIVISNFYKRNKD